MLFNSSISSPTSRSRSLKSSQLLLLIHKSYQARGSCWFNLWNISAITTSTQAWINISQDSHIKHELRNYFSLPSAWARNTQHSRPFLTQWHPRDNFNRRTSDICLPFWTLFLEPECPFHLCPQYQVWTLSPEVAGRNIQYCNSIHMCIWGHWRFRTARIYL